MARYYDHRSSSCEGCVYDQTGVYQNGQVYRACRWYGYIFHEWKGTSSETCSARRQTANYKPRSKSLREMSKTK